MLTVEPFAPLSPADGDAVSRKAADLLGFTVPDASTHDVDIARPAV